MENNKTYNSTNNLIVHHNADMDGISSALIAMRTMNMISNNKSITYNDEFKWDIVGYNYGKNPDIDTWLNLIDSDGQLLFNHIQFIDVTPPMFFLEKCKPYLISGELKIDIFDHHEFAYIEIKKFIDSIDDWNNNKIRYFYDSKYCGAYIYWDSVCNNTDWLFDTYGFLMNRPDNINNSFNIFIEVRNKFQGIPKSVSEYEIIKANIKQDIKDRINTYDFYDFMGTVSKWDTWGWYNENPELRKNECLFINEAFMNKWKDDFQKNIHNFFNWFFINENFRWNEIQQHFYVEGKDICKLKYQLARIKKHELMSHNGWKFAVVSDHANFFNTEVIKNTYGNIVNAVLYYNMSLIDGTVNISLRGINNINCSDAIKSITNDNGGGHKMSAGGQTTISYFLSVMDKLISPEDEFIQDVKEYNKSMIGEALDDKFDELTDQEQNGNRLGGEVIIG